jgi:glycosyltransferase involved in cell wall biosynthesis
VVAVRLLILRVDPWIKKFELPQRLDHVLPEIQRNTGWNFETLRIKPWRRMNYYLGYMLAFIATIPALLSKKYDILILENPYLVFFAPFAKIQHKKVITEYVDFYPSMLMRLKQERLIRYIVAMVVCRIYHRFNDWVITESRTTHVTLKRWKIPEKKLLIIPIAINTDLFQPSSSIQQKFRNELGINQDELVVGYIGKMVSYYKLENIILALDNSKMLKDSNIRGLFIGDGPVRSKLENMFKERNIDAIFTGTLPHIDLPGYYNAMDLFIFPLDSLAIKIGELLSMGIPLIAVQGMAADWIKDGSNGYLSLSNDPVDISKKIDEFLSIIPEEREEVSRRMREYAIDHLSLEKVVKLYLQVLIS